MRRTSADITIHRTDGTTFDVPITPEARRVWALMKEDHIRLRWDSATEYRAKVGDWVNDELFGPFYVTEEQEPTFDTATGAYRHDIRFDRDYIGWRNVLHMLAYSSGWNLYRRETDWSLTDTPGHHLDEIVKGLSVLGYNVSAVVEPSVESPNSAVTLSFSGTSVYDALNALSGACSCEWWVTYNGDYTASVIHLGKYELSNEPHVITLGDNAEDITPNKTSADRANRIYAFGSTRNIPDTYRKTLMFQVTDSGIRTSGDSSASVFRDSTRVVRRDMLKGGEAADLSVRLATPVYDGDGDNEARKEAVFSQSVTVPAMTRFSIKGRLEYVADFRYHEGEVDIRTLSWSLKVGSTVIASGSMPFSPQEEPAGRASKTITADVDSSITLTPGDHTIAFSVKSDTDVFDLVTATANAGALDLKDTGHAVDCPLIYEGNTYIVTFNPLAEEQAQSVFNWFAFKTTAPSGFGNGSMFTLGISDDGSDGLLPLKIPMSFYTDNFGELSSVKMVGERRLMLPESTPGYVQDGSPETRSLIERVVVFDEIYPKLYLEITEITEGSYADNVEWSDGSRSYGSLPKFTIKAKRITSRGLQDFTFRRDYLTSSPLQAVFATSAESGSSHDSSLSGMTFGLNFNEADQTYTIAFNEDYGVKLPNGTLKPVVGDGFILTGWNVEAITSLGIVDDAENDLLAAARAYLQAVSTPAFSWRCRMMSDSIMEGGLLEPGQRVTVVRGSLSDTTRIIGFEYKLDIPEDTPQYDCGETETYSHLRDLEKKLNAQTKSATASSGTVSSSYSASNESSGATLNGALSWKSGSMDDFAGDTFNGEEDKTITIPTEIGHLQGNESLPRIGKAEESTPEGTVVSLIDKDGNVILPKSTLDWFIAESYEDEGETKYRLKLNPKYQGMYAEGWVSAGGISETGQSGAASYLHELLDVNLPSQIGDGQALIWDANLQKWTSGDVTIDTTPFEKTANKVTSVSAASDNTQYPTAKAVYDIVNTMLSSAMRFQGVTTTALVDGSTTNPVVIDGESYTATMGDVVVRSDVGLEFLWTGAKWQQLGDETSYAKKTVTITGSGYLTGGGNLEAARTIDITSEVKTKIDNGATAFGYFTDGAANEAIKLRTPRTIWGQSFDGTADISGYMSGMTGLLIGESTTPALGTMEGATALGIKSATERYGLWEWVTGNGTAHLQSGRGQGGAVAFPLCLQELGGNVGIGTTSPAYKLDVNGVGAFMGSVYANYYNGHNNQAGGAIVINKGGDYFGVGPAPSNISDLAFGLTSDAEGTWKSVFGGIANNGNVGIGTSVPGALFHVHGPSGEVVRISQVSNYTAGSGPELSFYNSGSEKLASVRGVFDRASGQYGNLLLGTRTSDAAGVTTKMTILYNGNVGIGTTPDYKLDVAGDVRTSGKVYIGTSGGYLEVVNVGTTASPVYALKSTLPFFSDSWVSAGGVSDSGGGGAASYLHELQDVDDDLAPSTGQALVWDGTEWTAGGDISGYEKTTNKVTSISASSTDAQYPSAKAVHTALENYLPLAGGVMTGVEKMVAGATPRTSGSYISFIHYSGSSEVRDADVSAKNDGFLGLYARNGIALRPGTGSAFDTAKGLSVTASDITFNDTSLINTYAKKTVTIKGSGYLSGGGNLEANRTIDIAESIKEKIDSGAAAYTSLGNYLPLNGGTMTGSITLTSGSSSIYLTGSDTAIVTGTSSAIGTTGNSIIGQAMGNTYLRGINDPVYRKYRSNGNYQEYTMWHAGNDGSGSGLDADLLDGLDSERFLRTFNDTSSDFSTFLSPGVVRFSYDHPGQPSGTYNYGNVLVVRGDGSDTLAQLAFSYSQNGLIAVRSGTTTNIGDKPWRTLACKDDNVASATKLENSRLIWGQRFDGSKDVNGKFLFNNGDGTLKIYDVTSSPIASYGPESVAIQTAFDEQDPETSTYPGVYGSRCLLLLQPRGGRVGIGTTSPGALFHVNGPSGEVARISQVSNYTAGSGPELSFYNSGTEKLASVRGVFDRASGQYGNLLLGTRTSDAAGVTTKMTILYNGNVGIGTTPAYKLDVAGTVNINPSETAVPAIRIVASGSSGNHGINYVDADGNLKARFGVNSSTGLFQIFANGDVTMRSGGTSTSGFTISSPATSGNVTSYMMYPAIAGAITLNSTGAFSALGNGADLASPGTPMRSVSTKVIYLASGIYIYYDTVHNCIRTNAPIVSDSYISAGGVSTT